MIYFLLCAENYHWQWRAFVTSGACALYIFATIIYYWMFKLSFGGFTSHVLYLGYSALIVFLCFVLTGMLFLHMWEEKGTNVIIGSIGFFSTWMFVNKIYSSIKIE